MKLAKILGLLLLFLGVAIVLYSVYSSFQIFTGKALAPVIFKVVADKTGVKTGNSVFGVDVNAILGSQINQIIPAIHVATILNLISWSIGAWIMILGGGQLAGLGIKLIK